MTLLFWPITGQMWKGKARSAVTRLPLLGTRRTFSTLCFPEEEGRKNETDRNVVNRRVLVSEGMERN